MSVVFSGTFQGAFQSSGSNEFLELPSGVDYLWVYNLTKASAAGAGEGVQYYWQRGFPNRGIIYAKTAVTDALTIDWLPSLFFEANTTINIPGSSVAITGIDNSNPPIVTTGDTSQLSNFDIVRIYNTVGARQLRGLDFTINNIVANTSFELAYMAQIVNAAPGAGSYRRIPYNPYFYPSTRFISKISQAALAIVTLTVSHNYVVGQKIRFVIPEVTAAAFGMTQLNGVEATIVAIGQADADGVTNTITIDVDTSGFSAFAFPLTADPAFTPAQVIPVGENTAIALALGADILSDATVNQGKIGMVLVAGANGPAGELGDSIVWVAGKSFNL